MSRLFAADRTIGGLCTLFGVVVFFLGRTIPDPGLDPLGPGWMPKIIGIGLAVMGILIAVTRSSRGEKTGEPHESLGLVGASFALTVAYVIGTAAAASTPAPAIAAGQVMVAEVGPVLAMPVHDPGGQHIERGARDGAHQAHGDPEAGAAARRPGANDIAVLIDPATLPGGQLVHRVGVGVGALVRRVDLGRDPTASAGPKRSSFPSVVEPPHGDDSHQYTLPHSSRQPGSRCGSM